MMSQYMYLPLIITDQCKMGLMGLICRRHILLDLYGFRCYLHVTLQSLTLLQFAMCLFFV